MYQHSILNFADNIASSFGQKCRFFVIKKNHYFQLSSWRFLEYISNSINISSHFSGVTVKRSWYRYFIYAVPSTAFMLCPAVVLLLLTGRGSSATAAACSLARPYTGLQHCQASSSQNSAQARRPAEPCGGLAAGRAQAQFSTQ